MRHYLILLLLLSGHFSLSGQSVSLQQKISVTSNSGQTFVLFQPASEKTVLPHMETPRNHRLIDLDQKALHSLYEVNATQISINLPGLSGESLIADLEQVEIPGSENFFWDNDGNQEQSLANGRHYRGHIIGSTNSLVAFSFFENSVMGLISTNAGNLVIGKLNTEEKYEESYILYEDHDVIQKNAFTCSVSEEDAGFGYSTDQLQEIPSISRAPGDCVRIYIEVDHDIFVEKGSLQEVHNYVTGVFNQVAALYAMEGVSLEIAAIYVWANPSPYTNPSTKLTDFQNLRKNWPGDMAILLSYESNSIAANVNTSGFCGLDRSMLMAVAGVEPTYEIVPVYSWTVYVIAHELGHLFGSHHTHFCVWGPSGNEAIDGCLIPPSYFPSPLYTSCLLPEYDLYYPPAGGTIMSYCNLREVGINFSHGFGPQPGALIYNQTLTSDCLVPCGSGLTGCDALPQLSSGDCNGDGMVNAGDISAILLEIFDGDGTQPGNAYQSTFSGTCGCDANDDGSVNVADLTCLILLIFNPNTECGGMLQPEYLNFYSEELSESILSTGSLSSLYAKVPNPLPSGQVPVNLLILETGRIQLEIYSLSGERVSDQAIDSPLGEYTYYLEADNLAHGLYILKVTHENGDFVLHKIIK